jgi:SAM-dependent methyltransferase
MATQMNVQYGCGLSAPADWKNYDTSPTLRIQHIPVLGKMLKPRMTTVFPPNVLYGDIVKGLPVADASCDAVYCSHVLEHLSLNDFRVALSNTYRILKPGGTFRCVVPDLEAITRSYLHKLETSKETASIDFIGTGLLMGVYERPRGLKDFVVSFFGNARHLWMWDRYSLANELKKAGFRDVRNATFNDSPIEAFRSVEDVTRFEAAVAIECRK